MKPCPCGKQPEKLMWRNRIKYVCECGLMWWDGSTSTPATQEVMELRKICHRQFDMLWKSGEMTRGDAYRWMSKAMGLPKEKCHIGMFQKNECQKLLDELRSR